MIKFFKLVRSRQTRNHTPFLCLFLPFFSPLSFTVHLYFSQNGINPSSRFSTNFQNFFKSQSNDRFSLPSLFSLSLSLSLFLVAGCPYMSNSLWRGGRLKNGKFFLFSSLFPREKISRKSLHWLFLQITGCHRTRQSSFNFRIYQINVYYSRSFATSKMGCQIHWVVELCVRLDRWNITFVEVLHLSRYPSYVWRYRYFLGDFSVQFFQPVSVNQMKVGLCE